MEHNNLTIKEWEDEDRPREKMIAKGKKELTNAELIGIVLGSGVPGTTAVDLAKELLKESSDNLTSLTQMEITDFMKFHGIGPAKAVTLTAALELGRRMAGETINKKNTVIRSSEDLYNYMHTQIDDLEREKFMVMYLNNRNKPIGIQCVSHGGITGTVVDLRTVFKYAVTMNAVRIAVAHNHPSGDLRPSKEDEKLTQSIVAAAKLFNIQVLDHIIVGIRGCEEGMKYYSFHDDGKI